MEIQVNITNDGVVKYPLHSHSNWEIMYYIEGEGSMVFKDSRLPFSKGSIIVVPPNIFHGSASLNGFKNISISGEFSHLFMFSKPIAIEDNRFFEGEIIARLILKNRYGDKDYLASLCLSFVRFILQNIQTEAPVKKAVEEIANKLESNFADPELSAGKLLVDSGYAPDYIRAVFKKITGKTPVGFLANIRLNYAAKILEIYGNSLSVEEIAIMSGYTDTVYFSKQFKRKFGVAPANYKKI